MIIGIIDSGIDSRKFENIDIVQYSVNDDSLEEENPCDVYSHGTAMCSILLNEIENNCKIISFNVLGTNFSTYTDLSKRITYAIKEAVKLKVDIINISMGTAKEGGMNYACKMAFDNGIPIVVACKNTDGISYPYNCCNVIRVKSITEQKKAVSLDKDKHGNYAFLVSKKYFKSINNKGEKIFITGNSAAASYITAKLYKKCERVKNIKELITEFMYENEMKLKKGDIIDDIFNVAQIVKKDFKYVNRKFTYMKNVVVVPISKEISGFFRFENSLSFKIKQVLDPILKGNVGKNVYSIYGLQCDKELKIRSRLEMDNCIDSMIIGYTDKIKKLDPYFSLNNLLQIAYDNNLNIYSFEKVDKKSIDKFKKKGLNVDFAPIINRKMLKKLSEAVDTYTEITKPVISVFGTSSNVGKFTLQMSIKRKLSEQFMVASIGTEHQSELLGNLFCYPMGYMGESNIQLSIEDEILFLHKLLIYIEHREKPDIILTSGQSRLLPYNIQKESIIHNIAFLEGIKPDITILAINPLIDNKKYVKDTINLLESVFKCKVISIAYADKTPIIERNKILRKKLSEADITNINRNLHEEYGIFCGCITDTDYIDGLAKEIIYYLS